MSWYNTTGKDKDVVLSSRVRFARNLRGYPFPSRMDDKAAGEVIEKVHAALGGEYIFTDFMRLSPLQARAYFERHAVSAEFAAKKTPHALLENEKTQISVMLCEEDHIRLQCIISGLALDTAYKYACEVDDALDGALDIAYDEKLGYLTHCPTNLGTGMRASVMMFLPAMTTYRNISALSAQLQKIGLTIRGLYGEGSSADGCLYQISNQITLGITEEETLGKLSDIVAQIVSEERRQRKLLCEDARLCDRIARAQGTLRYAKLISSSEFMSLYTDLRLGIFAGIIDGIDYEKLDSLLVGVLPATLSISGGKGQMSEEERDRLRADYIRGVL